MNFSITDFIWAMLASGVWPGAFILVALLVLRKIGDEAAPVFKSIVHGLSQRAALNAPQYAIALGFGLSASLSAFVDVFHELNSDYWNAITWHQYAALWAKVLNPFCVSVLAYATQPGTKSGGTNPPFVAPKSP